MTFIRQSFWLASCVVGASLLRVEVAHALEPGVCSLQAGRSVREIEVGGATRRFWQSVGPRVPGGGSPAPLLLVWHGWRGSAVRMLQLFEPAKLWRDAIVVAPEGAPRRFPGLGSSQHRGWQIESGEFEDRDLRLFDAILKTFLAEDCVDSRRVYSTGFSNGGFFSNLLGCERADAVAAIAPVSGGGPREKSCDGRMPVLIMHGTSDDVVPYAQGEESFRRWSAENGCERQPSAAPTACVEATGCSADVRFCSFSGRHVWPGDAARRIVDFLRPQVK